MAFLFNDRLRNLVSRLGTGNDKAMGSEYLHLDLTPEQIYAAYSSSWVAKKIVDIPANDATRKWREWQAEADQITMIEAEEKRLDVRRKVRSALKRARALGGSGIYLGLGRNDDPAEPVDLRRVGRGDLRFITVLNRYELSPGELETDPQLKSYGEPKYWRLSNGQEVHPSRMVIFCGDELIDERLQADAGSAWGVSVLQAVFDACKNADSVTANIASLVFELKVDVLRLPDFMRNVGDSEYRQKVEDRVRLAQKVKGNLAALIMDSKEEYHQKQLNASGWNDLIATFMQVVSGAADIPMTRFLGQSPAGMQSTGESDMRNHYDRIQSIQTMDVQPAMYLLDECLIRSALGDRPDDIWYTWASLWQMDEPQRADVGLKASQTIANLRESELIPDEALSRAAVNMITELGVMPGLESEVARWYEGQADDELSGPTAEDESGQ